ncbi:MULTISPECIES: hypothetical protein [Bacillus cereus group]|uniref:Uncharacterized protein n=1 Tax=Bacillus thuringiensis TaxID=1428 RepID=B0FXZ3_BACTU|nr:MULTISPECIES: hypothetical protein [Bacillus cereus group]ABY68550.1 hypothetical protein pFR55_ORF083 [Bacillus thuringiensis]OMH24342.1 hypothetical protein BUM91_30620 [Bacillus thuringiensis]PFQ95907.1 hypothetical protein COK32_18320 [Bacillus cereus]HDR7761545.1 hypothetical protein [Bacillus cereus]
MKINNDLIPKLDGIIAIFVGVLITSGALAGLCRVVTYETIEKIIGVTCSLSVIIIALLMLHQFKKK